MKKVTFLFKNSGFYHCKSTQENTENENSWRFSGLKSLQKNVKKRKITHFSKVSNFFKTRPNRVLNSGKDS